MKKVATFRLSTYLKVLAIGLLSAGVCRAGDLVWFDGALPAGALGLSHGDHWNWISSSPTPLSGARAH
ncbi:MAG: hypothetical protein ACREFX_07245, partial [Opitutaceae bacterium]